MQCKKTSLAEAFQKKGQNVMRKMEQRMIRAKTSAKKQEKTKEELFEI